MKLRKFFMRDLAKALVWFTIHSFGALEDLVPGHDCYATAAAEAVSQRGVNAHIYPLKQKPKDAAIKPDVQLKTTRQTAKRRPARSSVSCV